MSLSLKSSSSLFKSDCLAASLCCCAASCSRCKRSIESRIFSSFVSLVPRLPLVAAPLPLPRPRADDGVTEVCRRPPRLDVVIGALIEGAVVDEDPDLVRRVSEGVSVYVRSTACSAKLSTHIFKMITHTSFFRCRLAGRLALVSVVRGASMVSPTERGTLRGW